METKSKDENANNNSLYQIPDYILIHLIINGLLKGGGAALLIHNSLNYKERHHLRNSSDMKFCLLKLSIKTKKLYYLWYVQGTRQ